MTPMYSPIKPSTTIAYKVARLLLDSGMQKGDSYAVAVRNRAEFGYSPLARPAIGAVMVPFEQQRQPRRDRLRFQTRPAVNCQDNHRSDGEKLPKFVAVLAQQRLPSPAFTSIWRKEQGQPVS